MTEVFYLLITREHLFSRILDSKEMCVVMYANFAFQEKAPHANKQVGKDRVNVHTKSKSQAC